MKNPGAGSLPRLRETTTAARSGRPFVWSSRIVSSSHVVSLWIRCGLGIFAALARSAYVISLFALQAATRAIIARSCHEISELFLIDNNLSFGGNLAQVDYSNEPKRFPVSYCFGY